MNVAAWLVHVYTASGAALALAALVALDRGHLRAAFGFLALQVVVDATDGALARLTRVSERAAAIDGAHLDDIVDYLTYVFVPAAMVMAVPFTLPGWALPCAVAMVVSSALGFARRDAKTEDHFFTGFPSYWNVVLLYLAMFQSDPVLNTGLLLALAALVFVPVRYVYPSRTPILQSFTLLLGTMWALLMLLAIWWLPLVPRWVAAASLVFPVYYIGLSLALEWRRRRPH
ncbi:MAG: CDP-diacylglycerol O-phosphatidyltransferase [Vicinamibacteraceae bacterium]|nr:CDP-diacylglycerol O-phosphatidyltransferase [Vicinamibacteraceae bacterium]